MLGRDIFPRFLLVLVAATVSVCGQAATITVDTSTDDVSSDGQCSLREAVSAANGDVVVDSCSSGDGDDVIIFAADLAGRTVTLQTGVAGDDENAGGDLDIFAGSTTSSGLTIRGPVAGDAGSIVLDGNGADRVIDIPFGSFVSQLQLSDLTIRNGRVQDADGRGGGIRVVGGNTFLSLDNVRVVNNGIEMTEGDGLGGGIFTQGPFSITASVISGNTVDVGGSAEGGGLYAALANGGDQNLINQTEISANSATSSAGPALGGGVYLTATAGPAENGPPTVAAPIPDQMFTTVSDTPATIDLTPVFTDPDGDSLVYSVSVGDSSVAGAVVSGVTLTVTPLSVGITDVSVTADDQQGGTVTDVFSVMVANQPPVVSAPIADQSFDTGDPAEVFDLNSVFSDPDGDALQFSALSSNPATASAMVSGGDLTITPLSAGTTTVTATADDQKGGTVDDVFAIDVAATNQPPAVASAIPTQLFQSDFAMTGNFVPTSTTIDLSSVFTDPNGDTLSFSALSVDPSMVTATVAGNNLTITPQNFGSVGRPDITVSVTATDPQGLTATDTFPVIVNTPPAVVMPISSPQFTALTSFNIELEAAGAEVFIDDDGDPLTYSASSDNAAVAEAMVSGSTLTVNSNSLGTVNITVTADDGRGGAAANVFEITFGTALIAKPPPGPANLIASLIGNSAVEIRFGNTTISGNSVNSSNESEAIGGGLYATGTTLGIGLNNVTVTANQASTDGQALGGGLAAGDGVLIALANTIVAGNLGASTAPDCSRNGISEMPGTLASAGFNLIGNGDGCNLDAIASDQVGSEAAPIDPDLGALGDNGGGTRTHALLPGSPAIDAGNPVAPGSEDGACETTDQRGQPRPRDGDRSGTAECDIGAFEAAVNEAPGIVSAIPDQTLSANGDDLSIDLATVFSDPEGDVLSFSADSSDPDVATAQVQDNILIVTPVAPGQATITVTASDSLGNTTALRLAVSDRGGVTAGGGGCVLSQAYDRFDPVLWLLLISAAVWRGRGRVRRYPSKVVLS